MAQVNQGVQAPVCARNKNVQDWYQTDRSRRWLLAAAPRRSGLSA